MRLLPTAWSLKPPPGWPVQEGHPLAAGLVGAWALNEAGGKLCRDSSGMNQHGTLAGAWTPSRKGIAIGPLAAGGAVTVAHRAPLMPPTAVTLEVLALPPSGGVTGFCCLASKATDDSFTDGYGLYVPAATPTRLAWYVGPQLGSATDAHFDAALTAGVWIHCVGTFDGVTERLYVNGVPGATGTSNTSLPATTAPFYIGSGGGASGPAGTGAFSWRGTIAHARLWNRALTPAEVRWLASDPYAMYRDSISLAHLALANPAAGMLARRSPGGNFGGFPPWLQLT